MYKVILIFKIQILQRYLNQKKFIFLMPVSSISSQSETNFLSKSIKTPKTQPGKKMGVDYP